MEKESNDYFTEAAYMSIGFMSIPILFMCLFISYHGFVPLLEELYSTYGFAVAIPIFLIMMLVVAFVGPVMDAIFARITNASKRRLAGMLMVNLVFAGFGLGVPLIMFAMRSLQNLAMGGI